MSIFCIGRNYVEHAHELGNEVPTSAIIFMKPDTALLPKGENFSIPSFTNDLHFEGELVLRVSKKGKNLSEAQFPSNRFKKLNLILVESRIAKVAQSTKTHQ